MKCEKVINFLLHLLFSSHRKALSFPVSHIVIPREGGESREKGFVPWIPASAGMTSWVVMPAHIVIPREGGSPGERGFVPWIPAFAGMTTWVALSFPGPAWKAMRQPVHLPILMG